MFAIIVIHESILTADEIEIHREVIKYEIIFTHDNGMSSNGYQFRA